MASTADRVFRDYVRYTGDGLPNEPVGHALPIGDPASGVHNPTKRDFRDVLNGIISGIGAVEGIAPYASFAAATDTGAATALLIGGRVYESAPDGPFTSADGRHWSPVAESSNGRPLLVLATGQSNMLGMSGTTGGERRTINGSVYAWEQIPGDGQTAGWKVAGPDSPDWPWGTTGNSLAYHFCDMLQRATGRPVYLVMHAAGGQQIAEWMPGGGGVSGASGHMFTSLNAALVGARASTLPTGGTLASWGISQADVLLWHQGEADADYTGTTGVQWFSRFRSVINTMRTAAGTSAAPMVKPGAPVLVGELLIGGTSGGNATDSRNAEIARLDRDEPLVASVSSADLRSDDNLHFIGADLQEFARRYLDRLAVFPKHIPRAASVDLIHMGGGVLLARGNSIAIAAGATVTVTLPVQMADAYYITTVVVTGGTPTVPIRVTARTVTSFDVTYGGTGNITVSWQVIGARA